MVAIIGVLVAISIPIFTSQLEKAREATDMANIRAAYAECSTAVLTEDSTGKAAYDPTGKSASEDITLTQKKAGWTGTNAETKIAGQDIADVLSPTGTKTSATVTVDKDGKLTVTEK